MNTVPCDNLQTQHPQCVGRGRHRRPRQQTGLGIRQPLIQRTDFRLLSEHEETAKQRLMPRCVPDCAIRMHCYPTTFMVWILLGAANELSGTLNATNDNKAVLAQYTPGTKIRFGVKSKTRLAIGLTLSNEVIRKFDCSGTSSSSG